MAADAERLGGQADRIRKLRTLARVSQETAAHEVGVSVRAYRNWEGGSGDITPDNLKKLAAYFGTTMDYIEYGTVEHPDPFDETSSLADRLETHNQLLLQIRARLDALIILHAGKPVNIEDYITQVLRQTGNPLQDQSGSTRDGADPGLKRTGARLQHEP